jgi:penicillin-binding protein 1C
MAKKKRLTPLGKQNVRAGKKKTYLAAEEKTDYVLQPTEIKRPEKLRDREIDQISVTKKRWSFKRLVNTKRKKFLAFLFLVCMGFGIWLFWDLPLPSQLATSQVPVSTRLFDRNGKPLYEIYADKKSTPVKLEEIPENVKQATIAIEDKDFYNHHGVAITGILRAAYKTVFRQKLEGGSTLTQQLVKITLLTSDRTLRRKIRELVLTLVVETIYSKDKILEMYLNQIPYGGTAYGIEAASELYFGKKVTELNLAESALLAGLTASPSKYSPLGSQPELAKERQAIVLRRMVEDNYITQEEADEAKEQELTYVKAQAFKAPHFVLWVKEKLAEEYGEAMVEKGGLRVTTSLDLDVQETAEKAVADEVEELTKQNVGNGAALVTRPSTGEILAMVGSKGYFAEDEDGKVNIMFRERQPGSSIKPLNYALAISDGKITASTPFADVPTCFTQAGTSAYCPRNYDGNFHGAVQTRFALGNSYNIPAVRTLALNGLEHFMDFANKMGITTFTDPSRYGLSLTLGGGEVHPIDMASAYGVFANQGIKQPLTPILKVEDWKGKVLAEFDPEMEALSGDRVLDAETSFIISHILSDNNARIGAFGPSSFLNVKGHPEVSVKTGTTNDRRDNWTIGYTPLAVVVAWVGNNDNSPMSGGVSGVSGASPIWNTIMKYTLDKAEKGDYSKDEEGHAWSKQPKDVVGANICATTGNNPGGDAGSPDCPTRFEYFKKDFVGATVQAGATDVQIDKTNGTLVYDPTKLPPENLETQNRQFLLDPLGTMVCLDCQIASQSATIRYPLVQRKTTPSQ